MFKVKDLKSNVVDVKLFIVDKKYNAFIETLDNEDPL